MTAKTGDELNRIIWRIVHETPASDLFTMLNESDLQTSRVSNVDALLGSGELLRGLFRRDPRQPENSQEPLTPKAAGKLPPAVLAEIIWHRQFSAHSPLAESAREILTSFGLLGAGATTRDLTAYRTFFQSCPPEKLASKTLQAANLNALTLRRDLFCGEDTPLPESCGGVRLLRCLGLDALGLDWAAACSRLKEEGCPVKKSFDRESVGLLGELLREKGTRMQAELVSFTVAQPLELEQKKTGATRLLTKCVLPYCAESGLPLVLRLAGRGVAFPQLRAICDEFSGVPLFLCGSGAEQMTAGVELAREFPAVWPLAGGGLSGAATAQQNFYRQGLELLGGSLAAFASGAEHILQLPGRWAHARWLLGEALQERYTALARTGWVVEEEEIKREVTMLLSGNALRLFQPCGL